MLWSSIKSLITGSSLLRQKRLPISEQRKHNKPHQLCDLEGKKMAKAKTLTERDLRKVLNYVAVNKHAARNRALVLITHWAGVRVATVASLLISDVLNEDGSIKAEVRLAPHQAKGGRAYTVFICEKLRKELATYISMIDVSDTSKPLFYSQKRDGFTANTLCQFFWWLYRKVGIDGASSHSGRRSFITNLANKGIGVRVLQSLANHSSISTTQAYIDVNDGMLRKAVELL
jgi:integrase/recombinase XerD